MVAQAVATAREARNFDVIVWGSTGFTGKLVAEYLARRRNGAPLRWAIAGRSREKLEAVRTGLAAIDPAARELPVLVGDARDPASLEPIVRATRVVATTVGPYALHGKELVASCAEHGTDYCDLTGETQFIREMIDRHHGRAVASGARIVHCCGFDSIPSDLGVLMVEEHARARLGVSCPRVKYLLLGTRGGVSGGTIASALNLVEQAGRDARVRKVAMDPYALDPEGGARGLDGPDQRGVRYDRELRRWTGPFLMAAVNTRVVRRTNALLGYPYGREFRYEEVTGFGPGPAGLARATMLTAGIGAFLGAVSVAPVRKALEKTVLPAPGQGPSKETRERGFFKVRLVGFGEGGTRVVGKVEGKSDPGYGETAKMLAEAAVCLAREAGGARGGVVTPAVAMGMKLVERLREAGMTFEVSDEAAS